VTASGTACRCGGQPVRIHGGLPEQCSDAKGLQNAQGELDSQTAAAAGPRVHRVQEALVRSVSAHSCINALFNNITLFIGFAPCRSIFVGTWNVNGRLPTESLTPWLSHDTADPDLYVIGSASPCLTLNNKRHGKYSCALDRTPSSGSLPAARFQELDLSASAFVFDNSSREDDWTRMIDQGIRNRKAYRKVHPRLVPDTGRGLQKLTSPSQRPGCRTSRAILVGVQAAGRHAADRVRAAGTLVAHQGRASRHRRHGHHGCHGAWGIAAVLLPRAGPDRMRSAPHLSTGDGRRHRATRVVWACASGYTTLTWSL